MSESKALVSVDLTAAVSKYGDDRYNSLLPTIAVGAVPDCFTVAIRIVQIDPVNETYRIPGSPKLALSKVALDKLANAAGVTWESVARIDSGAAPHYYEYEAIATVKDISGSLRRATGTKIIDLRSDDGTGAPGKDAAGQGDKQLQMSRKFAPEICASKARNRAISDILGIPRAMTAQQLAKPFVVPSLMLNPNHPMALQAMIASAVGAAGMLFGQARKGTLVNTPVVEAAEVIDVPMVEVIEDKDIVDVVDPEPPLVNFPTNKERMNNCWLHAKEHGMTVAGFRKIVVKHRGPGIVTAEQMTTKNIDDILFAVNELIEYGLIKEEKE